MNSSTAPADGSRRAPPPALTSGETERSEHGLDDILRIDPACHALGEIVGDVEPPPHAVDPGRFVVRIAFGRRGAPQAPRRAGVCPAGEPRGIGVRDAGGPHHADDPFARALEFGGGLRPGFADVTIVLAISLRSPALSWKAFAIRSTSAGGGVSAMKWRASLVGEMRCGRGMARPDRASTARPCSTPFLARRACPAPSARRARAGAD